MAERNEKVFERVRQELTKNPGLGSRELYDMAQQMEKSVGQQSLQQFHARYVLPIKREQSKGAGRGRKTRKAAVARTRGATAKAPKTGTRGPRRGRQQGSERDVVRAVLLKFPQDFSAAETKSEIVKVMSRHDSYVDDITARAG